MAWTLYFKDYLSSGNEKSIHEKTVMKRLLIVDDDPDHRLILRARFEAKGYGCEEAEDGGVALSKLKKPAYAPDTTYIKFSQSMNCCLCDLAEKQSFIPRCSTIQAAFLTTITLSGVKCICR